MGGDDWELIIKNKILPDLEGGRPGFDRLHTEAVVHWAKRICEVEKGLDRQVLVTAAYGHDWGYVGLFNEGVAGIGDVYSKKKLHMRVGAEKMRDLLGSDDLKGFYKLEQIERIVHLVRVHDELEVLRADDEIALMEADTLGCLDMDFVKPTFDRQDNVVYMDEILNQRRPLFRHRLAVEVFGELVERRVEYYERTNN
jgi:hypothetical protein